MLVRLSKKSRRFLELLLMSGFDALLVATNARAVLYGSVGWDSDRSAERNLDALRKRGLISLSEERVTGSWVAEITEKGRDLVFENIDPESSWSGSWDGKWRTIAFDLPQEASRERRQLNAWLRKRRFGHLQGSLWISHRAYADWTAEIEGRKIDPRAVLFQESVPAGRLTNNEYVAKAWPFEKINALYLEHLGFLRSNRVQDASDPVAWFTRESVLWRAAFELDPFLPDALTPSGYRGKEAWCLRKEAYSAWRTRISGEA